MVKKEEKTPKRQAIEKIPKLCTWCGKHIPGEQEVFALEVVANPAYRKELKKKEGIIVSLPLTLTEKAVDAIVVTEASEAKRKGIDLIFMLCSEACALTLRKALLQEKALFQQISAAIDLCSRDALSTMEDILDSLAIIHLEMRQELLKSPEPGPQVHAAYVLMGRIVTHGFALLRLLQVGHVTEAAILIRSIFETLWLFEYFDLAENEALTDLKKWIKGDIVKPQKVRRGISFHDEGIARFHSTVYKELSHYTHPTYHAATINMDTGTYEYNYHGANVSQHHYRLVTGYGIQALLASLLTLIGGLVTIDFAMSSEALSLALAAFQRAIQDFTGEWPEEMQAHIRGFIEFLHEVLDQSIEREDNY